MNCLVAKGEPYIRNPQRSLSDAKYRIRQLILYHLAKHQLAIYVLYA